MSTTANGWKNKLYFGDNLKILREEIAAESVDLIYLDPPFNSNASYNVLFAEKSGKQSAAQITAFEDTWHWSMESEETYHHVVMGGGKLAEVISAFRLFLGQNDMMAYLVMMAVRLKELHRVLKGEGSIYLHCDPTASHYLKLVMDAVFHPSLFRNEIVWKRTSGRKGVSQYGRVHDVILFYSKSDHNIWNAPVIPQDESNVRGHDLMKDDGGYYRLSDLSGAGQGPARLFEGKVISPPPGRHWMFDQEGIDKLIQEGRVVFSARGRPRLKTYLKDLPGVSVTDVWTDIEPINSAAQERLGYPTQKPEELLERIIKASSNEGDVVLDPFCGCGTTIAVAERLNRRWIGIDLTHLAISLIRHRLTSAFGDELAAYEVIGDPKDLAGARALAEQNRYQFEFWALGLVGAQPEDDRKRGADRGIDGIIRFVDDKSGIPKRLLVQVKSGKVQASQIRDLVGTMKRENAAIGAFITLEPATRPMIKETAAAGFYEPTYFPGQKFPRLQILTIEDLLEAKELRHPRLAPADTFKRPGRVSKRPIAENGELTF